MFGSSEFEGILKFTKQFAHFLRTKSEGCEWTLSVTHTQNFCAYYLLFQTERIVMRVYVILTVVPTFALRIYLFSKPRHCISTNHNFLYIQSIGINVSQTHEIKSAISGIDVYD